LGDIDGNQFVKLIDVVTAIKVLSGMRANVRPDYGTSGVDVSGNSTVEMEEAIYILQKVAAMRSH